MSAAAYNLLDERWIPVLCRSGRRRDIAPQQLSDPEDPPLRVVSPRPDFDGALVQFLIGLVQTCAAPETKREWRRGFDDPPSPDALGARFAPVHKAFWLDGDGPRFMQDLDLGDDDHEPSPIGRLLIEAPGENTLKQNKDFFAKRGQVNAMSLPTAAVALLTLQINAPSGGSGHRVGLRGGGPLTTLVLGSTLWQTVWLNVLRSPQLHGGPGDPERTALADIFPWMGPTRTSERDQSTTPQDIHPAHHFWGMPRRIRLDLDEMAPGTCDLSGLRCERVVRQYFQTNYGAYYQGAWAHPLTPYRAQKPEAPPLSVKGQPDGLPYRDWPDWTLGSQGKRPARAVRVATDPDEGRLTRQGGTARLWTFGYDMDNMKARCWYSGTMPVFTVDTGVREDVGVVASQLVAASEQVRKTLLVQVKAARFRRPKDAKGDLSVVSQQFWTATEVAFFHTLGRVRAALETGEDRDPALEEWLVTLSSAAREVFTAHSQERGNFAATDLGRVARAWNNLCEFTEPRAKKLRKKLTLPAAR